MKAIFSNLFPKTIFVVSLILMFVLSSGNSHIPTIQALAAGPTNYTWSIDPADAPFGAMFMDLKIDSADHLHLALGRDHLYYASSADGATWNVETVDPTPGAGGFASMALDSNGSPHIAYQLTGLVQDTYNFRLQYAVKNGNQWSIETVDSGNNDSISLALDNSDNPHIAYDTSAGLKYTFWTGSQWDIQLLDSCNQPLPVSMKIDGAGHVYIVYNCVAIGSLRFAMWDGTRWSTQVLETGNTIYSTSLMLDSESNPHIAYVNSLNELKYLSWNGSSWDASTIVNTAHDASLVLDNSGSPRIAYSDGIEPNSRFLKFAKFNGNSWEFQTLDSGFGGFLSLVLDSSQEPRLVYQTNAGNIKYIRASINNGVEDWSLPTDVVTPPSWVGSVASLTVDGAGSPHAAYYDYYQKTLRYAHWTGTSWAVQVVDTVGDWHMYPSIKTDANGYPHIAYFGSGGLRYASWDGTAWTISNVNGLGGRYASLAMDQNGNPHIAFCGDGLKYASWDGSAWSVETVDSNCGGGDFGGEISLTLDSSNTPYIAYNFPPDGIVTVATRDNVNNIWGIISLGENGIGISQATDSSGMPHIAFCHPGPVPAGGQIRYASWNGTGWDITTAGTGNCQIVSLGIGGDNIPHIAFPDYHFNSLEHLFWDGSTWQKQRLEEGILWTGLSYYTPVASDSSGTTWIAFSNWLDGDLYAAKGIKTDNSIPGNDQFENATQIMTLPYFTNEDISNTSAFLSDPIFPCTGSKEKQTLWFKYIPDQNGTLLLDTFGSNYDTVLGVWSGTYGNLGSLACSNDANSSSQSQVQLYLEGGKTYFIEVASRSIGNAQLTLNASFTNDICNTARQLTINLNPPGGGTTSIYPTPTCPGGKYLSGTSITLTATPAAGGYTFLSWSNQMFSRNNPFTLVIDRDLSIDANFIIPSGSTPSTPKPLSPANNSLVKTYKPILDWSNSTIPTGGVFGWYRVQVDDQSDFSSPTVEADTAVGNIAASQYVVQSALVSNTRYYWRVRAFNNKNNAGVWSIVWSFRTPLTPPVLESPADGFASKELRPIFDWDDVPTATGYTIQISRNNLFTQVVHTGNPVNSAYAPTVDLPRNSTLYWRVLTKGANGPSAYSGYRYFKTPNPPLAPVLKLPASNALVTNYTPLFTWAMLVSSPAFDHFFFQADNNSDFSSPEINVADGSILTTSYTPASPLSSNSKIYWRVRAVNNQGEMSSWSKAWYVRFAILPPSLIAPADDSIAVSRMPLLEWNDVTGNTGYTLQIWKAGSSPVLVKTVALTANISQYQLITALLPNTAYFWKVQTKGLNGPSAWSGQFDFTTGP